MTVPTYWQISSDLMDKLFGEHNMPAETYVDVLHRAGVSAFALGCTLGNFLESAEEAYHRAERLAEAREEEDEPEPDDMEPDVSGV